MPNENHFNFNHAIISGGIAGFIADTAMHSVDTVKTRMVPLNLI